MDAYNILLEAYKLITAHPYSKGAFARKADGLTVNLCSEEAVSFCSIGALRRVDSSNKFWANMFGVTNNIYVNPPEQMKIAHDTLLRAFQWIGGNGYKNSATIIDYNDNLTDTQVYDAWLLALRFLDERTLEWSESAPNYYAKIVNGIKLDC